MTTRFPVVGIGASAGGVEALESFFAAMPSENGMAFVVVTHLHPTHESHLADIIGRRTTMPVRAAHDGEVVEPQHVYVLPPGAIITMEQGHLRLRERGYGPGERAPVDIFFISLAEDCSEDAVGIVLSGGGSDGALGIRAIKENGGLTIAQGVNATEPRFKDMPESAAATGLVDLILPVEHIPDRLLHYLRSANAIEHERIAAARQTIYGLLRSRLGHDFSEYKDKTFGRRVERRMQVLQITNIDAYVERLQSDSNEISLLFRDLLIGVTSFFRDPDSFRSLETLVIPKIFEGKDSEHDVRIWVPGCSTGEEVFSIAILVREYAEIFAPRTKVQIFGTDIDEGALAVARAGIYRPNMLSDISPDRLKRFFIPEGQSYRLAKDVRDLCIFSPHSVLRDPPFSRLDLISCRNLLIYLKAELQSRVMPIFHYALRPDGFLFLGLSESVARNEDLFVPIDKQNRIYRRRDLVTPVPNSLPRFSPKLSSLPHDARTPRQDRALKPDVLRSAASVVLDRFAPAHVVVNEAGEVLHYSARTGKFLEPAVGAPSRDLLTMARKGLRLDLRAALRKAVETRQSVVNPKVVVEVEGGGTQTISLTVQPIIEGNDAAYLVIFLETGTTSAQDEPSGDASTDAAQDSNVLQLDRELQEVRQRLQATIEELETSNEELKSSNEEMLSVNEELQSTNEELEASKEETQSVNEELQTVNTELLKKITELDQSSSDLRNMFDSTNVGTVFLDRKLVIRSFTRPATDIFNLIPSDQGRPLSDIASRLDERSLLNELREVIEHARTIERRVTANGGSTHFLMRLLPYRAASQAVDGVLMSFADVTSIVVSELHQKELAAELSHRIKNTLAVIASIASQTGARSRDVTEFLETFLGRLHGLARTHELLSRTEWADAPLRELVEREVAPYTGGGASRLELNGPPVALKTRAALTLGMVIHELATNSVKYGALSTPNGRLKIAWTVNGNGSAQRLELSWAESDGPPPATSPVRGFGLAFIERAVRFELGGDATIAFEKTGLRCTISAPLGTDLSTRVGQ